MNVFKPDRLLTSGAEHEVYIQNRQGSPAVLKAPASWSWWQDMSAETAQADLDALQEYGIRHVPTRVHPNVLLEGLDGTRKELSYVLEQPFKEARPVTVADLRNPAIGSQLAEMFERSQDLYRGTGRSVDYVGFAALVGLMRSLHKEKLEVAIHNVLVTEEADKPGVELCDTRLFRAEGFALPLRWALMRSNNLQHDMVGRALKTAGYPNVRASTEWLPELVGRTLYAGIQNKLE